MDNGMEKLDVNRTITTEALSDFSCLADFHSGIPEMDNFIRNGFQQSVENHYCSAYCVKYKDELIAIFALSFDSLDLDSDDKEELISGISSTSTPNIPFEYADTFYSKPRYPALDIAYLAVQEKWRNKKIGSLIIDAIANKARSQSFAGCQFLTVEAYSTNTYSAVGFYDKCGFAPNEIKKPYKDTVRMFMTLYS